MKKRLLILLFVLLSASVFILSSCRKTCDDGHDFVVVEVVKAANCTEDGKEIIRCSKCKYEDSRVIEKLGHDLINEEKSEYLKSDATEENPIAVYYKHCSRCDFVSTETFEVDRSHVHSFSNATLSQYLKEAATCTSPAVYFKSCSCGEVSEETFTSGDALGHNLVEEVLEAYLKTAATETEYAVYFKHCSRCDHVSEETFTYIPDHNHEYTLEVASEVFLKDAATCLAPAVYYKSCSCGGKGSETFVHGEALGHDHSVLVSDKEDATCEHEGHQAVYKCVRCDDTIGGEIINQLVHTGGTQTCTEGKICDLCHEAYTEPLGHNLVKNNELSTPATFDSAGEDYMKCSRCDHFEIVAVPKLGHSLMIEDGDLNKATWVVDYFDTSWKSSENAKTGYEASMGLDGTGVLKFHKFNNGNAYRIRTSYSTDKLFNQVSFSVLGDGVATLSVRLSSSSTGMYITYQIGTIPSGWNDYKITMDNASWKITYSGSEYPLPTAIAVMGGSLGIDNADQVARMFDTVELISKGNIGNGPETDLFFDNISLDYVKTPESAHVSHFTHGNLVSIDFEDVTTGKQYTSPKWIAETYKNNGWTTTSGQMNAREKNSSKVVNMAAAYTTNRFTYKDGNYIGLVNYVSIDLGNYYNPLQPLQYKLILKRGNSSYYLAGSENAFETLPVTEALERFEFILSKPFYATSFVVVVKSSSSQYLYTDNIIIGYHDISLEKVDEAFLKSAADCDHAAVYYKSCSCGFHGTETFVYGDKLSHYLDTLEGILPTCTEDGISEGTYCTLCNKVIEEQVVIPALGHHFEIIPESGYPSTCGTHGRGDSSICSNCMITVEGDELPFNSEVHIWYEEELTFDENGHWVRCSNILCDAIKDHHGHQIVVEDYPGTWELSGTKETHCEDCSYYKYEKTPPTGLMSAEETNPYYLRSYSLLNSNQDVSYTLMKNSSHLITFSRSYAPLVNHLNEPVVIDDTELYADRYTLKIENGSQQSFYRIKDSSNNDAYRIVRGNIYKYTDWQYNNIHDYYLNLDNWASLKEDLENKKLVCSVFGTDSYHYNVEGYTYTQNDVTYIKLVVDYSYCYFDEYDQEFKLVNACKIQNIENDVLANASFYIDDSQEYYLSVSYNAAPISTYNDSSTLNTNYTSSLIFHDNSGLLETWIDDNFIGVYTGKFTESLELPQLPEDLREKYDLVVTLQSPTLNNYKVIGNTIYWPQLIGETIDVSFELVVKEAYVEEVKVDILGETKIVKMDISEDSFIRVSSLYEEICSELFIPNYNFKHFSLTENGEPLSDNAVIDASNKVYAVFEEAPVYEFNLPILLETHYVTYDDFQSISFLLNDGLDQSLFGEYVIIPKFSNFPSEYIVWYSDASFTNKAETITRGEYTLVKISNESNKYYGELKQSDLITVYDDYSNEIISFNYGKLLSEFNNDLMSIHDYILSQIKLPFMKCDTLYLEGGVIWNGIDELVASSGDISLYVKFSDIIITFKPITLFGKTLESPSNNMIFTLSNVLESYSYNEGIYVDELSDVDLDSFNNYIKLAFGEYALLIDHIELEDGSDFSNILKKDVVVVPVIREDAIVFDDSHFKTVQSKYSTQAELAYYMTGNEYSKESLSTIDYNAIFDPINTPYSSSVTSIIVDFKYVIDEVEYSMRNDGLPYRPLVLYPVFNDTNGFIFDETIMTMNINGYSGFVDLYTLKDYVIGIFGGTQETVVFNMEAFIDAYEIPDYVEGLYLDEDFNTPVTDWPEGRVKVYPKFNRVLVSYVSSEGYNYTKPYLDIFYNEDFYLEYTAVLSSIYSDLYELMNVGGLYLDEECTIPYDGHLTESHRIYSKNASSYLVLDPTRSSSLPPYLSEMFIKIMAPNFDHELFGAYSFEELMSLSFEDIKYILVNYLYSAMYIDVVELYADEDLTIKIEEWPSETVIVYPKTIDDILIYSGYSDEPVCVKGMISGNTFEEQYNDLVNVFASEHGVNPLFVELYLDKECSIPFTSWPEGGSDLVFYFKSSIPAVYMHPVNEFLIYTFTQINDIGNDVIEELTYHLEDYLNYIGYDTNGTFKFYTDKECTKLYDGVLGEEDINLYVTYELTPYIVLVGTNFKLLYNDFRYYYPEIEDAVEELNRIIGSNIITYLEGYYLDEECTIAFDSYDKLDTTQNIIYIYPKVKNVKFIFDDSEMSPTFSSVSMYTLIASCHNNTFEEFLNNTYIEFYNSPDRYIEGFYLDKARTIKVNDWVISESEYEDVVLYAAFIKFS